MYRHTPILMALVNDLHQFNPTLLMPIHILHLISSYNLHLSTCLPHTNPSAYQHPLLHHFTPMKTPQTPFSSNEAKTLRTTERMMGLTQPLGTIM